MSPRHIYNAEGYWVAFVVDGDVFDRSGDWLGHLVNGQEIYGVDGEHLGTLTEDGRLLSSQTSVWTSISLSKIRRA